MRAEAIYALSVWAKPSVLDRVDGRLRGEVKRNPAPVVNLSTAALTTLLKDKELPVRISAAKAIARLQIKQAGPQLLAAVKADRDADMRVAALEALVALKDAGVEQGITSALADREKTVRVAGLDLLGKMHISESVMVNLLMGVIANKTIEEKQAALLTLGKLSPQYAEKPLNDLLNKMAAGQLDPNISLELGEAIDSSHSSQLVARYKGITSKLSPDELMASYSSSLQGGDPRRGREIFFHNQNSQCMRCHSYDDRGGNAGPRLNGVAGRISREQILQALISPSARLAPGFGMVILELKDGKKLSGILQGETKAGLTIKVGKAEQTIAADQIAHKEYAQSSMPDMKLLLSKKEIRDVVSFLAEQKTDN
jgi:putative heme-binding domain-containing protein